MSRHGTSGCRSHNRDVARLGPIVAGLSSIRVFHTGPLTSSGCRWSAVRGLNDSSHVGIGRIEGDPVIVGFLHGAGVTGEPRGRLLSPRRSRYAMIVNRNPPRRGRVVVELQNGWSAVEISKHDGSSERPVASPFTVDLEPGDGRLYRLLQKP